MPGLEGKVALVTGAGGMRGIGRATAVKLARRGARIALTDFYRAPGDLPPDEVEMGWKSIDSAGDHIISQGGESLSVYCDLKEPDQIQEMQEKLQLSGFVAEFNAGGMIPQEKISSSLRLFCEKVLPKFSRAVTV